MKKTSVNLIPNIKNPTPDYYCTWQTQLYATNDGKPQGQRAIIGEKALFCKEKPYGWAYFYEQVRDNPVVTPNIDGLVPFVIASKNPNGAYAVATLGRTSQRDYHIPKCNVKINAENSKTIGVFGEYENLIINTNIDSFNRILIQDLADQNAYDITHDVTFKKGSIIISGKLIKDICMLIQPEDDTSEPGVVIQIF